MTSLGFDIGPFGHKLLESAVQPQVCAQIAVPLPFRKPFKMIENKYNKQVKTKLTENFYI